MLFFSAKSKVDPEELYLLIAELVEKEKIYLGLTKSVVLNFYHNKQNYFEPKTDVENDFQFLFETHHKSNGYSISPSKKILDALFRIREWFQEQLNAVQDNLKGFKKVKPHQIEHSKSLIKALKEMMARIDALKESE